MLCALNLRSRSSADRVFLCFIDRFNRVVIDTAANPDTCERPYITLLSLRPILVTVPTGKKL